MKGSYADDLGGQAIVFAPHPDDETLGCGGTIVRKLAQEDKVDVFFLTDGSRSHAQLPAEELAKLRRAEALNACGLLGVEERRVHFLGLEDGRIGEQEAEALAMVTVILKDSDAQEVFVTHHDEPSSDHAAANRVVLKAIEEVDRPMRVWEYPIWFWNRWPWIPLERGYLYHPWGMAQALGRGLPILVRPIELNCAVDIRKQLDVKRAALAQHRTQTTKYNDDPGWETLGELAGGRFLDMLLQPQELFLRHDVPSKRAR